ncbi:MAG: hypothetical protein H6568_15060 [Lewinellaceae bacterium]|nr:hypothetical protein [Lewinellaceae bacterium]HRW75460.1 hypothetical protein [Saprospiraceae bacterium]
MKQTSLPYILLIATILGVCGATLGQPMPKTGPRWSIGFAGGGGVSAILNHNTFGFPELDYEPSAIQTVGLSVGYAPKPWGRVQLGMQIGRADYTYSEVYGPYEGCTETPISIRKEIGLQILQIPLTYRHYFFNEEKVLAFNQAESRRELEKPRLFYLLGGFQVTVIRDASLVLSKNSPSTGNTWQEVDLLDIKDGFDCFVPIYELPDHLPEDRSELFARATFDAVLGAGLVMKLGPDLDIGLEGRGAVSLSDLNTATRNRDGSYAWRYQVHSTSDPEPYAQAFLGSATLFAVLNYSF